MYQWYVERSGVAPVVHGLLSIFLLIIFPAQIFLSFDFKHGLRAKPALCSSVSICGLNCHSRNVENGDKDSHGGLTPSRSPEL